MALVHLRNAVTSSVITTYTLRVTYETYDTLLDPCAFAHSDFSHIIAQAGLPDTLTWSSCTLLSTTIFGRTYRYVLEIVVTG